MAGQKTYISIPSVDVSATNLGTGAQVYKDQLSGTLEFRSLTAGTNIAITQNANDITILSNGAAFAFTQIQTPLGSSPAASGPADTLTLSSTDLDITGNALTDTITYDIKNLAVTNAKIANATIDLTTKVTGILPIANGGTNSNTALNNNRIIRTAGGSLIEASAITINRALISDASGIPTHSSVTNTELGYVSGVTSAIQTQLNSKGTVSSVGLSMPSIFSVASSPITGSGTIGVTLATQTANKVFASPSSGAAATPTFRALTLNDMPSGLATLSYTNLIGDAGTCTAATSNTTLGVHGDAQILAQVFDGAPDYISITPVNGMLFNQSFGSGSIGVYGIASGYTGIAKVSYGYDVIGSGSSNNTIGFGNDVFKRIKSTPTNLYAFGVKIGTAFEDEAIYDIFTYGRNILDVTRNASTYDAILIGRNILSEDSQYASKSIVLGSANLSSGYFIKNSISLGFNILTDSAGNISESILLGHDIALDEDFTANYSQYGSNTTKINDVRWFREKYTDDFDQDFSFIAPSLTDSYSDTQFKGKWIFKGTRGRGGKTGGNFEFQVGVIAGSGTTINDYYTLLALTGAKVIKAYGSVQLQVAGDTVHIKEGTNACMGKSTLVAGTVTVSTTAVTANSRIFLTHQNTSGTAGFVKVSARTAGTSFTITSSSATDTSDIAWILIEPT